MPTALTKMKTATKSEPIASAQATTTSSEERAATVMVTRTTREDTSFTTRALQLGQHDERALRAGGAAHAVPGKDVDIEIERTGDGGERKADGRADCAFPGNDREGL